MASAASTTTAKLRIVSVCRALPSDRHPASHVFVLQRLAAMRKLAHLRAVEPVPYFPGLRPKPAAASLTSRVVSGVTIQPVPMFYVPGILKRHDGLWMQRAIRQVALDSIDGALPDAIDAHFGYPEGVACVEIARRAGIHSFVTIRGLEVDLMAQPVMRRQVIAALNAATGCVSVSHSLRDMVVANGADPARIRVIHNAIDRSVFKPGDKALARNELGLSPNAPLVVSVGRLVSGKGHHVLIEAFNQLRQQFPDAVLAIIGPSSFESDYPARLAASVAAAGGPDRVRLLGALPQGDVVRWLHAADLFALATIREGCCNAVLEALASGIPVVTTPAGDNAYFVKDGMNGYIFPVGDAAGAADAMLTILRGPRVDPDVISRGLPVGNWNDVAEQVLAYFSEHIRLADTERRVTRP